MNRTIEYLFGTFSSLPILITSWFLSRFVSNNVAIGLFIICFIIILFTNKFYNKNRFFFIVCFVTLIFCTTLFFDFVVNLNISEEEIATSRGIGISWILILPLSFIFSFVMGVLFDVWKNKFVTE